MIVASHFKGHIQTGFGGAIKNIGMGGVSPWTHKGELNRGRLHGVDAKMPKWIKEKCTWCKRCEKLCPLEAIAIVPKEMFEINDDLCWRCGRCSRICTSGALEQPITSERIAYHIVEASKGVLSTFKPKKVIYINFIFEVQPECDCLPNADAPVVNDQGIIMGDDPVAVDRASLDLVNKARPNAQSLAEDNDITEPCDVLGIVNRKETHFVLDIAEKFKLGTQEYELIEIKKKTAKDKGQGDVEGWD